MSYGRISWVIWRQLTTIWGNFTIVAKNLLLFICVNEDLSHFVMFIGSFQECIDEAQARHSLNMRNNEIIMCGSLILLFIKYSAFYLNYLKKKIKNLAKVGIHSHFLKWPQKLNFVKHCFTQLQLTLNVRRPSYLGLIRSISWLLMPWLLAPCVARTSATMMWNRYVLVL